MAGTVAARERLVPRAWGLVAVVLVASIGWAARAHAVPLRGAYGGPRGFGTECLGPSDDGSSAAIPLASAFPRGLRFFEATHSVAYVNTNGSVSFSGPVGTFTPDPFPVASQAMIAPFWADVDTRGEEDRCARRGGVRSACQRPVDNGIWWDLSPGRLVVTWHQVGYFECHTDRRASFQLILTEVPGTTCGAEGADFDVEMRYALCEWTTGDASGGSGGRGGTEAQAGFDAGNLRDFVMIPGSRTPAIGRRLCEGSNAGTPGLWRFAIRGGVVICPDAGAACDTGQPGVCAAGHMSCSGETTSCVADVSADAERCNALDDDCDGAVDDGDGLCPGAQICDRGACVEPCFEGACAEGFVCGADGRCAEDRCAGVTCADGQLCEAGGCVEACAGVACPVGRACRAGRCVDPCATLDCGECGACQEGRCVPRCSASSCSAGQSCVDGVCVPTACADCPAGTACGDVACVDACAEAVCPRGERCEAGDCVAEPPPPPPPPVADASEPVRDAAVPLATDAGVLDGSSEVAPPPRPSEQGGCSATRTSPRHPFALALLLGVALLLGARRAR